MQWISGCRAFSYQGVVPFLINDLVVLTNLDMETNKHVYILKLFNESGKDYKILSCNNIKCREYFEIKPK